MSAVCFDLKSNQSAKRVRELRLWSTHYEESKAFSLKPSAGMIDVRQRPAPRLNRRKPRERRHAQKILRDVLEPRSVPIYAVRDTPRWRYERERGRTRSLLPTPGTDTMRRATPPARPNLGTSLSRILDDILPLQTS